MADEACFVIDEVEYPIPGLDGMNMQEAVVLYERSGLTLEDFAIDDEDPEQVEELEQKTKHPGFLLALVQIAYMRGHPKVTRKRAEQVADQMDLIAAYEAVLKAGIDKDPTPTQQSEATSESSAGNGSASGDDSTKSLSSLPEQTQLPIGTFE
ncbi:MAG TPA: hypothetical protein VLA89_05245 [Gemmatimonadales bacterium]|nr:hypothetical protein [Gemmatimonadales bacterium]